MINRILHISAVFVLPVLTCSALSFSAFANLITNGSFETTIGRTNPPFPVNNKDPITGMLATSANFTGPATTILTFPEWRTTQDGIGCVVFPGTYASGVCGTAPSRFGGSGFWAGGPGLSPDGGNFILIDGDRTIPVSTTIYQTLNNLNVGQFYNVTFYQAAAEFLDSNGPTTEQWDVSLGIGLAGGLTSDGNFVGGEHHLSSLLNTPNHGFHAWELQTLTFQATAMTEVLGFFAVGTPGGEPPIVLLDGVSVTAVPEPETGALLSIGLLGIILIRKKARNAGNSWCL